MGKVQLFGALASTYSCRVEIALKLKGVEYEFVEEDLSNKSPLLLKYNPVHKKIPVLVHNGKAVTESSVILEYIDEAFDGPSLLPKDPYERANARFWANFLEDKFKTMMAKAFKSSGEEKEKANEELMVILEFLEDELKGKKFFGGQTIGFVDVVGLTLGSWFGRVGPHFGFHQMKEDKLPHLCRWVEEYNNCSFVKESVPSVDKLIEYITAYSSTSSK